jgi:hypothetical protein
VESRPQLSSYRCGLAFGRCSVRISIGLRSRLTVLFRVFFRLCRRTMIQSFEIGHDRLVPNLCLFTVRDYFLSKIDIFRNEFLDFYSITYCTKLYSVFRKILYPFIRRPLLQHQRICSAVTIISSMS